MRNGTSRPMRKLYPEFRERPVYKRHLTILHELKCDTGD